MRIIHVAIAATAFGLVGHTAYAGSDSGKAEEYVPEAEIRELHKGPLHGMEGKEVVVKEFTVEPGFVGERHQHAGPVFVYVVEGELGVETEAGEQTFGPGDLYPEPLDVVMRGKNASAEKPAKIVVFQINDVGEVMMKKAE